MASATPSTAVKLDPLAAAGPRESASVVKDAIEGAHRLGVTGLNTVAETAELEAYEALRRDDRLPLRVVAAVRASLPLDAATLARLDALRAAHAGDPVFRVDAVALKVVLPAAPARPARRARTTTAAAATAVAPATLPQETQDALAELDRRDWNVVLQVDDERALDAALDGLGRLAEAGAPPRDRRHRIELARPMALDVARIRALGVAISLPLPDAWAPDAIPAPVVALTTTDPDSTAAGLRLLMASESLADPRLGLQALLTSGETAETSASPSTAPVAEASLAAAIDAYTRTAAWASGDERRRGAIARDMLADIVILSADLFTLSADKLLDAVVTMTIFDGKVVYDREAESVHATEP